MSDTTARFTLAGLIYLAAGLVTEPGDSNPEYDRALAELVTDAAGDSMERRGYYLRRIRRVARQRGWKG